jgi:hypothetical protein
MELMKVVELGDEDLNQELATDRKLLEEVKEITKKLQGAEKAGGQSSYLPQDGNVRQSV